MNYEGQKVRWGLLSTANINRRLIPAIRASERGELVAVASRSLAPAEEYARQWGIPLAYGSYEELLNSDKVDVIYNPLPNHLHAEWSIKALQAGKHVLCEKPFALTLAEVDQMSEVAQKTGRVLTEAFMYRHHPQTQIAKEWVKSGRLGELSTFYGVFSFTMNDPHNVRLRPEWGGGCLWDVGIYPLSFAQYMMDGPPEWVMGSQQAGPTGVDEVFSGLMQYKGGRTAQIVGGFRLPWHTYVEITGTLGRLVLTRPFVGLEQNYRSLAFHSNKGEIEEIPVPQQELYSGEVEDIHSALLDGTPPYISLTETRNHVRTVLALYESAGKNQVVRL